MTATLDAATNNLNFPGQLTLTQAHTIGATATALFVIVAYWSTSSTVGQLTGITWNGGAMSKIGDSGRSNGGDIVELYFLAGPTTGNHNVVASFQSTSNDGSMFISSWNGTPSSGGSGVVWADLTILASVANGTSSSLNVPNNTAADAIIDAVCNGGAGTGSAPTMGVQTNRLSKASTSANGNGEGWSTVVPAPAGTQTMNWTFTLASSAQLGVRILAAGGGGGAAPPNRRRLLGVG